MRKYVLLIALVVAVLGAGGYWLFDRYLALKKHNAWSLVPPTALLVYERNSCASCVDVVKESPVWKAVRRAALYQKENDSIGQVLKNILAADGQMLISLHATKRDDFDVIFYARPSATAMSLFQKISARPSFRTKSRFFSSTEIRETTGGGSSFSWTMLGDVWVGSFTPFLVEDVIRSASTERSFGEMINTQARFNQVSDDAGNLYVNLGSFPELLSLFSAGNQLQREPLGHLSALDVKSTDDHLDLNGFSMDTTGSMKYVLSIFRNQSPVSFQLRNVISNNTIALQSFGVSDGLLLMADLARFSGGRSRHVRDSLAYFEQKAGVPFRRLFETISNEVAVCSMESAKATKYSRILLVETNDPAPWVDAFRMLADKFTYDTLFFERFGDYEIREVPVFRFPEKLFWPLVSGFDRTFYTVSGKLIIIGDNLQDLRRFIGDMEEDNTWGRSVSQNKFVETMLLESNYGIYINTPKVWNFLSAQLRPRWSRFITENQRMLRSIVYTSIQFSHIGNGFYTNISIHYSPSVGGDDSRPVREKYVTHFQNGVQGMYAVRSHVDRSTEVLVQDSLNDLSLVSEEGAVLWKIPVGDRITSAVSQVDYFANGKLQYFFTTRAGIHVIDRLGNYVSPFPVMLSAGDLQFATVVDYDHSRKYRFLTSDHRGRLWMYDKEMKALDGWQPRDVGGPLVTAPAHHRIKGRDFIIAVRRDGWIYLMNRRGEDIPNFPLDLGKRLSGDYFVEEGNSLAESHFTVVSDDGVKIRFSPEGKVVGRETLLKSSVDTRYTLVAERNFRTYIITQQDPRHFFVLDETGKTLVSNHTFGPDRVVVSCFDFGGGRSYVAISDMVQHLTYIYDASGNLITDPPIQTNLVELRSKDTDTNLLFSTEGHNLVISPIGR